ncbi:MAG: sigma-70 family RNA polymerase sigma factor [Anaerolineae bacterium]
MANFRPRAGQSPWGEDEFESLFLAHYDAVYRVLFRVVGSQQEAEDLAQETFLRLYRQRFPQGREHNLRAWLCRVATNLAYNALRSHRRRERREEIAGRQAMAAGGQEPGPEEHVLRQDEQGRVRQALACLRPRESQLLLLRYAGLSYREVAEVLDVVPGSVGTLLARAEAAFERAYQVQERKR